MFDFFILDPKGNRIYLAWGHRLHLNYIGCICHLWHRMGVVPWHGTEAGGQQLTPFTYGKWQSTTPRYPLQARDHGVFTPLAKRVTQYALAICTGLHWKAHTSLSSPADNYHCLKPVAFRTLGVWRFIIVRRRATSSGGCWPTAVLPLGKGETTGGQMMYLSGIGQTKCSFN